MFFFCSRLPPPGSLPARPGDEQHFSPDRGGGGISRARHRATSPVGRCYDRRRVHAPGDGTERPRHQVRLSPRASRPTVTLRASRRSSPSRAPLVTSAPSACRRSRRTLAVSAPTDRPTFLWSVPFATGYCRFIVFFFFFNRTYERDRSFFNRGATCTTRVERDFATLFGRRLDSRCFFFLTIFFSVLTFLPTRGPHRPAVHPNGPSRGLRRGADVLA